MLANTAALPALIFTLALNCASAATLTGRVVRVHDGDTLTILDSESRKHEVRLAGIDAPELNQPFGQRAKEALSQMMSDQQVSVEWRKHDFFGRIVGKVFAWPEICLMSRCDDARGRDVSLMQLLRGMAWHFKRYQREQSGIDRQRYSTMERGAREDNMGLWADATPVPPWEWRRAVAKGQ